MEEMALENMDIEIIDGDRGKNYPNGDDFKKEKYCLFLNAKNVTSKGFEFNENMFISKQKDEILRKGKLKKYDIVLTTRGTVGNVGFYSNDIKYDNIRINSGMVIIRNNNFININNKYIYWYLKSPKIQKQIMKMKTGSAQPQLPISILKKLKIVLPNKKIQDKITKILDNIEQKIKLNNQINDNLLGIGISLINRDYIVSELVNIGSLSTTISKGTTPTKKDILESDEDSVVNFIKVTDFDSFGVTGNKLEKIPNNIHTGKLKRSILKEKDLLVSIAGTLGKSAVITKRLDNSNTNQAVAFIRLKDNKDLGYLYFYTKSKYFQEKVNKRKVHAVQPNLSLGELSNITVPIIKVEDKGSYNVLLDIIIFNIKENEKLEQLRDILLPKLMNGEIDLENIEV